MIKITKIKVLAAWMIVGVLLASCGGKNKSTDDAVKNILAKSEPAIAVSFKGKEILDKGGISNGENIPGIAKMMFSDKVEYFTNPEKAGFDLSNKAYFLMSIENEKPIITFIVQLSDKEAFEKLLKSEGGAKWTEQDGFNVMKEGETAMAWNENMVFVVVCEGGRDRVETALKTTIANAKAEGTPKAMYSDFLKSDKDINYFYSADGFMKLQGLMSRSNPGFDMSKMADLMKGSYSLFTLNFETDRIVGEAKNVLGEKAKKELNFIGNTGVSDEFFNYMSNNQPVGYFAFNGNLQKYFDMLVSYGLPAESMNEFERETGMSLNDLLTSIKGSMTISFNGVKKRKDLKLASTGETADLETNDKSMDEMAEEFDYDSYLQETPEPSYTVAANLNGNLVTTILDSILRDSKKGNYYSMGQQYIATNGAMFLMSNDENIVAEFAANGKLRTAKFRSEASDLSKYPIAGFFDFAEMAKNAEKFDRNSLPYLEMLEYAKMSMKLEGGSMILQLKKTGKNSLWTIINMGKVQSEKMMSKGF